MKQRISILLLLLLLLGLPNLTVRAVGFSTSLQAPTTLSLNQSFTLRVSVANVSDLLTYEADFDYDRTKLTVFDSNLKTGSFEGNVGTRLVMEYLTTMNGNFLVAEVSMKATENFKVGESTTIRLSGVSGSDGERDVAGTGASITLTMSAAKSSNANLASISVDGLAIAGFSATSTIVDLGVVEKTLMTLGAVAMDSKATVSGTGQFTLGFGKQSFPITVTAEDGSTKVYTVRVERADARSSNNYLRQLQLSAGEIVFSRDTFTYHVIVDHSVAFLRVVTTPEDGKASVNRDATYPLSIYENRIQIPVMAENGERRVYTLNVSRRDANGNIGDVSTINNLSSLIVEGYALDFSSAQLKYEMSVENQVTSLLILATAEDDRASVSIEGHTRLNVGQNSVKITVTSQSGESKVYQIEVSRASDLPILTLDNMIEYLSTSSVSVVSVQLEDEYVLTSTMIQAIRQSGKTIYFFKSLGGQLLYGWYLDGRAMLPLDSLDLFVELHPSSKMEVLQAGQNANMSFAFPRQSGVFPPNTRLQLNISEVLGYSDAVSVYQYDQGEFTLLRDQVNVIDGIVEFDVLTSSQLVLSDRMLVDSKGRPWLIPVLIGEGLLILLFGLYLVSTRHHKQKRHKIEIDDRV